MSARRSESYVLTNFNHTEGQSHRKQDRGNGHCKDNGKQKIRRQQTTLVSERIHALPERLSGEIMVDVNCSFGCICTHKTFPRDSDPAEFPARRLFGRLFGRQHSGFLVGMRRARLRRLFPDSAFGHACKPTPRLFDQARENLTVLHRSIEKARDAKQERHQQQALDQHLARLTAQTSRTSGGTQGPRIHPLEEIGN